MSVTAAVHPTAVVAAGASLGDGVTVGPYATTVSYTHLTLPTICSV